MKAINQALIRELVERCLDIRNPSDCFKQTLQKILREMDHPERLRVGK